MIFFLDEVIIDGYSCAGTRLFPLFQLAKFIIVLIQISVPFGLVIWGSLDWFKALIAHDEKEMRMKRKPFIQRVIAAIIVLVLPWLVQLIAETFAGKSQTADFWTCYSEAKARIDFSSWQKQTKADLQLILLQEQAKADLQLILLQEQARADLLQILLQEQARVDPQLILLQEQAKADLLQILLQE